MDLDEAMDIIQQCIDNTNTTVKDARIIDEAWQKIKAEMFTVKPK